MTATFEAAIPVILWHEVGRAANGGYTNDPDDPGGPTKYGVSFRYLHDELAELHDEQGHLAGDLDGDGDVDADDIRIMTLEQAEEIYRLRWWDRYGYGRHVDQQKATKIFDCAVNMGATRAHIIAQRAANSCGAQLELDGVLGERSLLAINACDPRAYLLAFMDGMIQRYRLIVQARPRMSKYLGGWTARARWPFVATVVG